MSISIRKKNEMGVIGIEIPQLDEEQDIEVEVRVNGLKRNYTYRVEIFYWSDCSFPAEDRVKCIRQMVDGYDSAWHLTHIGIPNNQFIPITFRKKN